jgi:hypothetical protein
LEKLKMNSSKVVVKLSSKSYGGASGSFTWCVALNRDFILERGAPEVRFKLHFANDKLTVVLGESGNLLSTSNDRNSWIWKAVSSKNSHGLEKPVAKWPAREFEGIYNKENDSIDFVFPDGFPAIITRATQPIDEEDRDSFKVKPRLVKKRVLHNVSSTLAKRSDLFSQTDTPNLNKQSAFIEQSDMHAVNLAILPSKIGLWTDENMRALNALLQDAQMSRRDIVCTFENGIVTIKKIKYESI